MLLDQLRKEWRVREASCSFDETPRFTAAGLVLGAGTMLAKFHHGRHLTQSHEMDRRLEALLAAAYGRPITSTALAHVKTAVLRWNERSEAVAALHLALARLGHLEPPIEAAQRLFMADGLMAAGATPAIILKGLGFEPSHDPEILKFPGQAHRPAGPGGGWWMPGHQDGVAGTATHPAHSKPITSQSASSHTHVATAVAAAGTMSRAGAGLDLGAMTTDGLGAVATFVTGLAEGGAIATAATAAGAVAAFGVLVIPSTGPKGKWIDVGGPGNVSYFRQPDEVGLRVKYTGTDGVQRTISAAPDPNGDYRGPDGRVIARWVKAAAKMTLVISTATLVGHDTDRPDLCPAPTDDRKGARDKDRDYEDYVKKVVNPDNPTPRGMGYSLLNPTSGNLVAFDDCQHSSGAVVDAKGTTYASMLKKDGGLKNGVMNKLLEQADRQINASGDRPIIWFFAERRAADEVRKFLGKNNCGKIRVVWLPWKEGMK